MPRAILLADDEAWERLAALQERAPVCLTEPHGAVTLACIVGNAVIWDRALPPEALALEPALSSLRRRGAPRLRRDRSRSRPPRPGRRAGRPLPRLEHFAWPARDRILDALVALLAPETARHRRRSGAVR